MVRLHKSWKICMRECESEESLYENQFGDYCVMAFPSKVVRKEWIFRRINFKKYIWFKIRQVLKLERPNFDWGDNYD